MDFEPNLIKFGFNRGGSPAGAGAPFPNIQPGGGAEARVPAGANPGPRQTLKYGNKWVDYMRIQI